MDKLLEPKDVSHDELRFVAKVELLDNGCWLWRGGSLPANKDRPHRTPVFWTGGGKYRGGKSKVAYRYAYEKRIEKLPDQRHWAMVRQCETELCANPYHYEITERKKLANDARPNLIRAIKAKPMCRNGLHERTPENTIMVKHSEGKIGRTCRPCLKTASKKASDKYLAKKRAKLLTE